MNNTNVTAKPILKLGINDQISNRQYHADEAFLSSSSLKQLLKDPTAFHKEKILKLVEPREEKNYFDEGSHTHSLILEPALLAQEYAYYEGWRKAGTEYQAFKEANQGKTILSKPQVHRTSQYLAAYNARPEAVELLKGCLVEHTLCSKILDVPVKVRCDAICPVRGYIADVKTTAYPSGIESFKKSIKEYGYDLSAALYCQVAYDQYKKLFDFYFIVISKQDLVCDIYKCSPLTLTNGHAMVNKALVLYKKCLASGEWKLEHVGGTTKAETDYTIELV